MHKPQIHAMINGGSELHDIAQLLFTLNNENENFGST
ncbi:hypothetical protein T02_8204 [Trichinella nativa]|uniref:Uncharacterized protein n=1 Tax=Trichinella nativa TaxID=6335 RepID=A0A0V1KJL2_9BILA|nr:hypothetical protein T02_8204 [Trichinella nativa]